MRKIATESIKDGKANVGLFSKYKSDNTVKVLDLSSLDWIQEIDAATFMGFSYVEEIKLPNGVKIIGDMVFSNCRKLKKVEIPQTVTSLGDWVFTKCQSLTKISIPASVVDCGCYIFSRCIKLKEVIIDKSRQEVKEQWGKQWNGDTEKDLRVKFKEDVERERVEAEERERIEMEEKERTERERVENGSQAEDTEMVATEDWMDNRIFLVFIKGQAYPKQFYQKSEAIAEAQAGGAGSYVLQVIVEEYYEGMPDNPANGVIWVNRGEGDTTDQNPVAEAWKPTPIVYGPYYRGKITYMVFNRTKDEEIKKFDTPEKAIAFAKTLVSEDEIEVYEFEELDFDEDGMPTYFTYRTIWKKE